MEIDRAGVHDAALLARLHGACFDPCWDRAAMESLLGNGSIGWIGGHDGKPVGMALVRIAADEAELLSLAVLQDIRRSGLGRALLKAACTGAREAGAAVIFLEVARRNQGACRLYEAAGFALFGQRPHYYPDGEDALLYRMALAR